MARLFNGTTHELTLGSALISALPVTIAAWARSTTTAGAQTIAALGNSTGSGHRCQLRFNVGNVDAVYLGATTSGTATTPVGFSANTWYHCCGVFAAVNSRSVYLNGGNKGTNTTAAGATTVNRTSVGSFINSASSQFLSGLVAEVGFWNVALTDAEVAALASGVLPFRIQPSALVAYYPVWGLHSPEINLAGGSNALTVTGATLTNHAPVRPFTRLERVSVSEVAAGGFEPAWARGANRLIGGVSVGG